VSMLQRGYTKHPKIAALSDAAFRLWQAANDYCDTLLTDGVIHKTALTDRSIAARSSPKLVAELLKIIPPYKAGLWEDHGEYYLVHDYLDWNDSRETVQASRARARERSARFRAKQHEDDGAPHDERAGVTNGARNGIRNGVTNGVTNGIRHDGIDRSIDRSCTDPPNPPSGGLSRKITRAERKKAEDVRRAWGRCQHDPSCQTYEQCVTSIVMTWREQTAQALQPRASPEPTDEVTEADLQPATRRRA